MSPKYSSFHELIGLFQTSFQSLSKDTSMPQIERLSSIVHQVMSGRERRFHTIEHAFGVSDEINPIGILAGLFHDIVYVQIDKRIHPLVQPYLSEFTMEANFQVPLPNPSEDKSPLLPMIYDVFGFQPGNTLTPFSGENEFLSAVVACRLLSDFLDPWEWAYPGFADTSCM